MGWEIQVITEGIGSLCIGDFFFLLQQPL